MSSRMPFPVMDDMFKAPERTDFVYSDGLWDNGEPYWQLQTIRDGLLSDKPDLWPGLGTFSLYLGKKNLNSIPEESKTKGVDLKKLYDLTYELDNALLSVHGVKHKDMIQEIVTLIDVCNNNLFNPGLQSDMSLTGNPLTPSDRLKQLENDIYQLNESFGGIKSTGLKHIYEIDFERMYDNVGYIGLALYNYTSVRSGDLNKITGTDEDISLGFDTFRMNFIVKKLMFSQLERKALDDPELFAEFEKMVKSGKEYRGRIGGYDCLSRYI